MGLTWTVQCPLPGLEHVAVTYNLMACEADLDKLQANLGQEDPGGVVVAVEGLDDAFGPGTPIAFRAWAVRGGFQRALVEFATDPNYSTGSKRSTRRTPTDG